MELNPRRRASRLVLLLTALALAPVDLGAEPAFAPAAAQARFASRADHPALLETLAGTMPAAGKILHPDDLPALGDGYIDDQFGYALAISGDSAVVGAYSADAGDLNDAGAAYVYTRQQGQWHRQARLQAPDAGAGHFFGWSVAIAGDMVVVGAPNAQDTGAVYVFTRTGSGWTEQARLRASDATVGEDFGWSVAVEADTLVVGALENFANPSGRTGSAYVYERDGLAWTERARLVAPGVDVSDGFGWDVALSAGTLAIGAPFDDHDAQDDAGSVHVYTRDAAQWNFQARLTASDPGTSDQFGFAVALHQDATLIGAWLDDTPAGSDSGSAFVFQRQAGSWAERQKLIANGAEAGDHFGASLALDGNVAAIGAFSEDGPAGADGGAAHVYAYTGDQWQPQAELHPSDAAADDAFGWAVAVSGGTVLAGAYRDDTSAGPDAGSATAFIASDGPWAEQARLDAGDGATSSLLGLNIALHGDTALASAFDEGIGVVFVYLRIGNEWQLQARLQGDDAPAWEGFGEALALEADTALIGAPNADTPDGTQGGAVYVFVRNNGLWTRQAKWHSPDASGGDAFGKSIALSGDTALVGAPNDDGLDPDVGSAHVFERSGEVWMHRIKLGAASPVAQDSFGAAVALSGSTALVGAPGRDVDPDNDPEENRGAVLVFQQANGVWTPRQQLMAAEPHFNARFGHALACSDRTVLVGAPFDLDADGLIVGSVHVYTESGGSFSEQARLRADDPFDLALFGWRVALSGDQALVGTTPLDARSLPPDRQSGLAYSFARHGTAWTQQDRLSPADGGAGDGFGSAVALTASVAMIGAPLQNSALTGVRDVGALYLRLQDSIFGHGFED